MGFSVRCIKVGETEVPGPELFWMSEWSRWYPLWFQVVLVRGPGVTALVNTGPPDDLAVLNEGWASLFGERGALRRSEEEKIVPALAAAGVTPAEVTHVLLTPLQLYTTGNVALFDNAEICMSKRGWVHFHTTHAHPHDNRWRSLTEETLVHLVTDAWDRVRLLEDEDELTPGIRTWWAGAHHRASIAVEVDTSAGTAVISDSFFYYENVEDDRILGITENIYEAAAAYARARRAGRLLVPLYDPKVFDRFPGGLVADG